MLRWETAGAFSWNGFWFTTGEEENILWSCINLLMNQEMDEAALLPEVSLTVYNKPDPGRAWPDFRMKLA